jgi:FMN-dependent NADH-azoreductase
MSGKDERAISALAVAFYFVDQTKNMEPADIVVTADMVLREITELKNDAMKAIATTN